jgi:PAS domain S-box-containing protein
LNDPRGVSQVIREGKAQLVPQVTDEMLRQAIPNEEQYQILRQLGMRSVLIVPLISRGTTLGALTLVTAESGRVLGKEDLEVAESLATRAAVAIDNSRLYEAMSASRNEALSREEEMRILDRVGSTISSELDLKKVVQSVTDAGRELSGAEFGAFFYNVLDNTGEKYMLYTLSGAPEEAFNKFPMPRNTAIFAPTFSGEQTVRIDDVRKDERYGKSAPYHGMPPGHLPVRSYLAVSVKSRSGDVLGGLFYGHSTPGIFTERSERLLEGIAKQAAIAIENANLFEVAKRQRTQLQESEAQLRAIIETTPECVKIVRRDGTLLHMNSPGLRMVEAENAEMVVGKNVYDLISPEDRSRFQKFNEKICAGETGILEFDLIGFRGSRRSMETHAAPLQTPEGTAQLAVTRDVTDRKQAETVTGRLAAIVESSDDAIVSKNLDGIIKSWNKAAERIFGFRAEEAIGQPITLIIPQERRSEEATIINRIRNGQRIDHFETFRRRKDGTLIEVSLTISPVKDSAGRIVGASKVARDITERRRSEAALREGEERLRKTEKLAAAGQLAASLAHEINNPLSSVTNALYLLNTNSTLDEAARDVLGMARAELSRMSRIVKQSLSYYRADRIPKDVNVGTMVNESLQVFSAKFDRAGIQLTKNITDSGTVPGFADEIRQVIDNLLLNAVESMPNGGRLSLSVHSSREWKNRFRQGIRMTVGDSGSGIPQALLSKIFEPFFTTKAEKGTGLGLWVVRGIVAKHEGAIRVRSSAITRRTGTVISVFLPRASDHNRRA